MAVLQETKWFGEEVYMIRGSVLVVVGRPVLESGDVQKKGEDITIMLSRLAITAWKEDGIHSCWKAWNSRLLTVTLKFGRNSCDHLHALLIVQFINHCKHQDRER